MTEQNSSGADFFASRTAFLARTHKQIWSVAVYAILPMVLLVNLAGAVTKPCWQSITMVVCTVLMGTAWAFANRRAEQGYMTQAVVMISGPGIALLLLILLLKESAGLSTMVAMITMFTYLALFSNRALKVGIAVSGPLFGLCLLATHFGLVAQIPQSATRTMIQALLYLALFLPCIAYFLVAGQRINQALYVESQENLTRNREVLAAVERAQPELDQAIGAIGPRASAFASSASELAATSAQMSMSLERIGRIVAETAAAAADARGVAERVKADATTGREKLHALEGAFQGAVPRIEAVRGQMDELAEEVSRTEDVNRAIHDIAESLSMLGINASLEAAKAGEQGKGFAVVAQALQQMVAQTNTDLKSANKMLDQLRQRATRVTKDADASTSELRSAYDGLVAVSGLLEGITTSFANSSASVQTIAGATEQQRSGISDISAGVRDMARVAAQLSDDGRGLSEGLSRVVGAHEQLRSVLKH
ncbi:MAG TPA: methyl-accepting chemotaxis protein [Myxococcales bacterium]